MNENEISHLIIGAAIRVHKGLGGPGLLEAVYEEALAIELTAAGLRVSRQEQVPLLYRGVLLANPLRLDLLVNDLVLVEVKSVMSYNKLFEAQALTYLRMRGLHLALVINFGSLQVRNGIHRVVNNFQC